ncbi:hypothetical protein AALP_AA1G148100 [Arabis alpina]|uniref:Uncharacterized protein n=1 Tax=Arabis alpina TaxID=50452 RepID=A0A087HNA2_ARAAL|nr:hypothetical protein AALP_AA1G148100 [Arabis alpina]
MSGTAYSNDSTKLIRRSIRKTTTADLTSQSAVRADPPVELIALSSREDDSSDDGSINPPTRASPSNREDEADSGGGSDRLGSEPDEEDEDGDDGDEEGVEDEDKIGYEHLHFPAMIDPNDPLGPRLGPTITLCLYLHHIRKRDA